MGPSGSSTPISGGQSVSSSLLRPSSGMLGAQGGSIPSQNAFPSLISPRSQFNNMSMLGNVLNGSSQLNQSFGNGMPSSALGAPGSSQRCVIDSGAESDPLSSIGNGMSFSSPASFVPSNPGASSQVQGQEFSSVPGGHLIDRSHSQKFEHHSLQKSQQQSMQQFSSPHITQQQQQQIPQQQFQSARGELAGVGHVKMEPQTTGDQLGEQPQKQLQSLRNLVSVKLEPQQMQSMRSMPSVKLENQSEQSIFLQQQQQQQQQQQAQQQQHLLPMSRHPPQASAAQINLLQQQRLLQLQQPHQQQQLMKIIQQQQQQQQRPQLPPQFQQNSPLRSLAKPVYEPGMCARRLTHYMYHQQQRPEDNNIEFWRKFVAEYFAPNAKKKWCVSMYGSGRQTTGVFPQDVWHCEICNRKPGRGFEATVEVLPRLYKIKYESGTLEELLYVDMPREYQNSSGQIVLDYAKAIQESVFEQLRVVRDGQLRIVFSQDLKICSWEFCARHHEELIPRRLLIPQVSQLGAAAQKYQGATQGASSNVSAPELQSNSNMLLASARQLAKALEVPLVNELGYTKRYVRCLQISEVVNSMKDLIDYSGKEGCGPMESLTKFPRRAGMTSVSQSRSQQQEDAEQQQQQLATQNLTMDQAALSGQATTMQQLNHGVNGNVGTGTVNSNNTNPLIASSASPSSSTIAGMLRQNSMSLRQQNSGPSTSYGGNASHGPATIPPQLPNASSFHSNAFSSSNTPTLSAASPMNSVASPANMSSQQQGGMSAEQDPNDTDSSVQKILQEVMSGQISNSSGGGMGGGSLGNNNGMKQVNGIGSNAGPMDGASCLVGNNGNGPINNNSVGFGPMMGGGGVGQPGMLNGFRTSNSMMMNGRVGGMGPTMVQMQGMNRQLDPNNSSILNGLRAVNGFDNLQFDWKTTP